LLALLEGDRVEGGFRDGIHSTDASDVMRAVGKGAA
jgi:hypothetical protein